MRKIIPFVLFSCLLFSSSIAQLPSNSTAEDWTLTDINGQTHNLYTMLDQGYTVFLDFSATWCPPCWSYHNSGAYEDLYNQHGPNGTNEVRVFFIESDLSTGTADLYGNTPESLGNWVAGTPYPIIDVQTSEVPGDYQVNYYPTLYAVCPDRKLYEMNQDPETGLDNWIQSCSLDASLESTSDIQCFGDGNGAIDISTSGGYGNTQYDWSNGANTEDLSGIGPGTYSCTISDSETASDGESRELFLENISIDGPEAPVTPQLIQVTDVLCNGESNGSIDIEVSGGTPGYTYSWSNGGTVQDLTGVPAGSYTVTITDANSCQKTLSGTVTEPTALSLQVNVQDATCGQINGSLTLIGSGGTGDYVYDIGNGQSSNEYFPNLAPGSYDISMIDDNNCSTFSEATIENIPSPTAEAGENTELECSENSIELDGSNSAQGPTITYQWTTNDGNIVSGQNSITPSVDRAGVYTLEVTDENTGCVSEDMVEVIAPPGGPGADAGTGHTLTCSEPETELDGSDSESGDHINYEWTTDDGNIVSGANTTTPLVDASGTYLLTVTDEETGCTNSSEVSVDLDETFPAIEIQSPAALTCKTGEVTLDGTASDQGSDLEHQWIDSEGNVLSDDLTVTVSEAGIYTLEIENTANGCSHEEEVMVENDTVPPQVNAGENPTLTCEMNSMSLNGAIQLDSNYSIQWETTEGNIISGAGTLTPEVDQAGWYILMIINDENGCQATDSVEVILDEDTPEAIIAEPTHLTCMDSAVVLDGSQSSDGIYEWSTEGGNIVSGADSSRAMVDEAGMYTLEVTNPENGCISSTTVTVDEITSSPSVTMDYGIEGLLYEFSGSSPEAPTDWYWDFGDGTYSEKKNPVHYYFLPGKYKVCLTVTNDCGERTRCMTITVRGPVAESDLTPAKDEGGGGAPKSMAPKHFYFHIYPNPVSTQLHLRKNWKQEEEVNIRLVSDRGKTVQTYQRTAQRLNMSIDLSALPDGLYFIVVESDGETSYKAIIKQ